jgi:hypothetical protein
MLLAQVGYGRGSKVHEGLDEGTVTGAILSPKDEGRDRLEQCVIDLRSSYSDSVVMIDPQFYVTTLNTPRDGHLPEYDYYAAHAGLGRTQFSPRQIERYVGDCLNYQHNSLDGISYLVSPNVMFDDFRDSWSQIALNMAEAAVDHRDRRLSDPVPLLVSIVTSEVALRSATGLAEFLDALSSLEADGFYILVHRNSSTYQAAMDPNAMANLMYMAYVLARVNDYQVFVGYSDWLGMLLQAVGTTGTASGWHQSLRQFNMGRFMPAEGGGRARKRYSSAPLLSAPLLEPELEDIFRAGRINDVLTGSSHDAILRGGPAAGANRWTDPIACRAHWASLESILSPVSTGRIPSRLVAATQLIDQAETLYARLAARPNFVNFEAQTGPGHLAQWREAITAFRAMAGV